MAGGGTNYSLSDALGTGRSDLFQAGMFGRQNIGAGYLSAALAYGWHDVTTNRTVALPTGDVGMCRVSDRTPLVTLHGRTGSLWTVALSGDWRLVASGGVDGMVRLTKAASEQLGTALRAWNY